MKSLLILQVAHSGYFNVQSITPIESKRKESTINSILNATINYLEFLARTGDFKPLDIFKMERGQTFKSFLHHINKGKLRKRNTLKLKEKKKLIEVLEKNEVEEIVNACISYRDKFLLLLLNPYR